MRNRPALATVSAADPGEDDDPVSRTRRLARAEQTRLAASMVDDLPPVLRVVIPRLRRDGYPMDAVERCAACPCLAAAGRQLRTALDSLRS